MTGSDDKELGAIQKVIEALKPLDRDETNRVIHYVLNRLGVVDKYDMVERKIPAETPTTLQTSDSILRRTIADVKDIKSLKEEKQPKSANQMAALVAYYLTDIAPQEERKQDISSDDVKKYFKQAVFQLPRRLEVTLRNAKNAGYFDSVGNGMYKLNPVGYNLVVHGLPSKTGKPVTKTRKKKRSRKKA